MGLYIRSNGYEDYVYQDIIQLYPGLAFTAITVDGNTYYQVDYLASGSAYMSVGEGLFRTLITSNPAGGDILIIGDQSSSVYGGQTLRAQAGWHRFVPRPNSTVFDALIAYDVTDCMGGGFIVFDGSGNCIAFTRPVILFHELAHSLYPYSADTASIELLAIADENRLRAEQGLPLRADIRGGCRTDAQTQGLCSPTSSDSGSDAGGTSSGGGGGGGMIRCFVASAATGGPRSVEVRQLRRFREGVLMPTRWGRAFFEDFYEKYYSFAPDIAGRMTVDEEFRDVIGWALVDPLLNHLRLVVTLPEIESELEDVKADLPFLKSYLKTIDTWLSRVPPPITFWNQSAVTAAWEIGTFFRYLMREDNARTEYLQELTDLGELPLQRPLAELRKANWVLLRVGLAHSFRSAILGSEAAVPVSRLNYSGAGGW
jgi:hypothetical protein